eukprot:5705059-Prorocentrum_lima.AAC.1
MLEADEKAAAKRKSSWEVEEAVLFNAADVERKGGMTRDDNANTNTSYTQPKPPPCRFYMKT